MEKLSPEKSAFLKSVKFMIPGITEKEVSKISKAVNTCFLCGKESFVAGGFQPNEPEKFGCTKGGMHFYGLCIDHFNEEGTETVVDVLQQHYSNLN